MVLYRDGTRFKQGSQCKYRYILYRVTARKARVMTPHPVTLYHLRSPRLLCARYESCEALPREDDVIQTKERTVILSVKPDAMTQPFFLSLMFDATEGYNPEWLYTGGHCGRRTSENAPSL